LLSGFFDLDERGKGIGLASAAATSQLPLNTTQQMTYVLTEHQ